MKTEKSAGMIVYYKNKEIKFLLLKYATYWGFPKGLIENKESEIEAAKRELKEEAGLENIKIIPKFKYKQEWFYKFKGHLIRKEAVFFLARIAKEEAKKVEISFEHEDFAWLSFDDALKKLKIKANQKMLKKANDFIKGYENQKTL